MKLAILSGTFDPIHNSHIALVEYVKTKFSYDKILLIPAGEPPFKNNSVSAVHRLEMVKRAASGILGIEVCDTEVKRAGKSYSILTVNELNEIYSPSEPIGFIIGTDAYINLPKWYQADELKKLVKFILFERELSFDDERVKKVKEAGFNYVIAKMPFVDISSSKIREAVRNNEAISQFVAKEVEEYIVKNGLYK